MAIFMCNYGSKSGNHKYKRLQKLNLNQTIVISH